jgi:hypothetical protein
MMYALEFHTALQIPYFCRNHRVQFSYVKDGITRQDKLLVVVILTWSYFV